MSDFSKVISGPAIAAVDDTDLAHTQGGIQATITPQNRGRVVDEFGGSACDMIHTGDEVRVTVPLCQWDAATLAHISATGNDQTAAGSGSKYMGIGRSAGFIYPDFDLKITPMLSADAGKRLQLFRACQIGAYSLNYTAENDQVLSIEHAGLVDESSSDGELIGRLTLTTS